MINIHLATGTCQEHLSGGQNDLLPAMDMTKRGPLYRTHRSWHRHWRRVTERIPKRRSAEGQRRQWKLEHPPSSHDLEKSTNLGPQKGDG